MDLLEDSFQLHGDLDKETHSPIPPYRCSDSLSQIFINAEAKSLFKGFQVGIEKINLSNSQFADDMLILMDGEPRFGIYLNH